MHVRKEKRNPDGEQQAEGEDGFLVQPAPVCPGDGKQVDHVEECKADPGDRSSRRIADVREDGKNRRGVVVQAVPDAAGLVPVKRNGFPEGPPEADSRQHQHEISGWESEQVLPGDPACHQEHRVNRQDEHSLQLDAKGNAGQNH